MARSSPPPRKKSNPRPERLAGFAEDAVSKSLRVVGETLARAAKPFRGDVEPIHDVRVSTRRAAATLQFFEERFSKRLVERFRKRLKRIRRAAGAARDADVLVDQLTARKEDSPLLTRVQAKQKSARKDIRLVRTKAKDKRWFKGRLRELLRSLERKDDVPLHEWTAGRWEGLSRDYLQHSPTGTATVEALHRFRIRTKTLRYQLELLENMLPPRACQQTLTRLIRIQDDLGKLIDKVTGLGLLERLKPAPAKGSPGTRQSPSMAQLKRDIDRSRKAFLKAWVSSRERELSKQLNDLIARMKRSRTPTRKGGRPRIA